MEQIFAVVVTSNFGQQVFYVGENTELEAAATLVRQRPGLIGADARFFAQPGILAHPLGVTRGSVVEWRLGHHVQLTALTGSVK